MKKRQSSFIKNAMILSAAGIFSRMIGALYRIPLYRLISGEGLGLYQMGYYIYNVLLAVSATGIPIAISKLVSAEVSQNRVGEARRIFRLASIMLLVIGGSMSVGVMLLARRIATDLIMEPRAYYPLVVVAPAIGIVALMASFRGFFQGLQKMWPTAISQLVEQIVRVLTVLGVAYIMMKKNAPVELTAAGASVGVVTGSLGGLTVMLIVYYAQRHYIRNLTQAHPGVSKKNNKELMLHILRFAIPITLGAMVIPVMNGIDTFLIPRRLQASGWAVEEATHMYGDLSGAAIPLINLPSMFASALAASLVPTISQASAVGEWNEVRRRAGLAIKLILMIGIPAGVGLSILAPEIVYLLYKSYSPAGILRILGFSVIFLTLHQTCTGILQGLGYTRIPVTNLIIGGLVKIVLNYTLTAIPALNINGAAIASVIAFAVSSGLNITAVMRHANYKPDWKNTFLKPAFAAFIMALVARGSIWILRGFSFNFILSVLLTIAFAAVTYFIVLIMLGIMTREEYLAIPVVGPRLVNLLDRLKLLG